MYIEKERCVGGIPGTWIIRSNTKSSKNYTFNSLAAPYDIDFDEIASDLSKKSPIAVVTINETVFGIVHASILDKAHLLGEELPFEGVLFDWRDSYAVIHGIEHSDISILIDWAKGIRLARWPEGERGVVTVAIPKI